ncbi:MAG: BREX system P-loop protein BrxC [Bryobacteraceae bacterium]
MLIKDCLLRDPSQLPLVNNGQARVAGDLSDSNALQALRGELSTFVCEGQYADGMYRILDSFLKNQSQPRQPAAWVSGFFGSGKSHLLQMLAHLWRNTEFPDGATARSLVPTLPDDIRDLLRELDIAGKRSGGLLAAPGSMPSGTIENVRLTVLGIILRACKLPEQYQLAQFQLWLLEQGYLDRVQAAVAAAGKTWAGELNNLYVSPVISKALLACDKNFAPSEAEARKTLRAQFPGRTEDLTTPEFLEMARRVLKRQGKNGQLPCTILILDEIQQYIGDSEARSTLITEVAEAVSKSLDSQVVLVGAGQSALTSVKLLNKLMDRFTIRVQLSDTDVEAVTRKVLLQKQPTARGDVTRLLETHAGEISRQLQGTKIAERSADKPIIADDYPLLPVRRRFWEECFRQVDAAGTQSQLRSQLRIIYDSLVRIANQALGSLVPAADLFEALAPEMVSTGKLPREINERIVELGRSNGSGQSAYEAKMRQRIAGLVFLIGQLNREASADKGIRATKEQIADLLVEDLNADNGKLRNEVAAALDKLAAEGRLMRVGSEPNLEFRIQTEEGRAWDADFKGRETRLRNDATNFDEQRDRLLNAEVDRLVRGIKLLHGAAKEPRSLFIARGQEPPQPDGESIPIWIQDGFSGSAKAVEDAARKAGQSSPVLFVFIPSKARQELLTAIATVQAAEQTLIARQSISGETAEQARQSMNVRLTEAKRTRDELISEIVGNARVFKGGGNELLQLTVDERLKTGAEDALARLFPRFKEADYTSAAWEAALKRARDGADRPFEPVKYDGNIEQHLVSKEVISAIGIGKTGTQIRKELESSPFGWPRDAVDTAIMALHHRQFINATLNGSPVAPGQLDQNKIQKAEFRVERTTLSHGDRLAIRKLYLTLGIKADTNDIALKAPEFLRQVLALAKEAGGDAPLPALPTVTDIEDIERQVGNDQLSSLAAQGQSLISRIESWKQTKQLVSDRLPGWRLIERLVMHAKHLPSASGVLEQVDGIRDNRMLLDASDPATPIRARLADLLRNAVNEAHQAHEIAYSTGLTELEADANWQRVPPTDRASILSQVGLSAPLKPDLSDDTCLLNALDNRNLPARRAEADAVATRVENAVRKAAQLLEPKVHFVAIERATLRTPEDVNEWTGRVRETLLNALQEGPVQVQ